MTTILMIPPVSGNRNSITVNSRTYSSLPNMAIAVQSFDVPMLSANGWMAVTYPNAATAGIGYWETLDNTPGGGVYLPGSPAVAIGMKRLVAGYNGPAINITAGGVTSDIYFNTVNDNISFTQLYSFLNGNVGTVNIIYNQGTAAGNATLPSATYGTPASLPIVLPWGWNASGVLPNNFNLLIQGLPAIYLGWDVNETSNFNNVTSSWFGLPSVGAGNSNNCSALWAGRLMTSRSSKGCLFYYDVPSPSSYPAMAMMSYGGLPTNQHSGWFGPAGSTAYTTQGAFPAQPMCVGFTSAPSGTGNLRWFSNGSMVEADTNTTSQAFATTQSNLLGNAGPSGEYSIWYETTQEFIGHAFWNGTVLTDQQMAQASSALMPPPPVSDQLLVLDGDSILYGYRALCGMNMVRIAEPLLRMPSKIINLGVPSQTEANIATYNTATSNLLAANNAWKNRVYVIQSGINDIVGGTTGATLWTNTATWLAAIKSAQSEVKCGACTLIDYQNGAYATQVAAYNSALKAAVGGGTLDFAVDFAAIPVAQNSTNRAYFNADKIHPEIPLYALMAPVLAAGINSISPI